MSEFRYFHVNSGTIRDDIFAMNDEMLRVGKIWDEWAAKNGGTAVFKGRYCAGLVGNKPEGWIKDGMVGWKTVYRPKAKDNRAAYDEYMGLPKKPDQDSVLGKHGFHTQLMVTDGGFNITAGTCGVLHGQAYMMVPKQETQVPEGAVELAEWEWVKWQNESASVEAE